MQLSHPNLPKVHEVFVDQTTGRAFLVMDFIDGETLEEMLQRLKRPLTWQEAQPIFAQVINALNHLHRNKVVHRDIKPSNIIVTKRNEKVHVFLVDFGVAKVMEEVDPKRPRSSSIVAWTDGYSPPEQYASGVQVDARADQYALAATMVFALTGKTPDDAFTRMEKFRKGEPTLPPKPDGVPESVWKAIEVAMRFEPSQRFDDVNEFWDAVHVNEFWRAIYDGRGKPAFEPSKAGTKLSGLWSTIKSTISVLIWFGFLIAILWDAIWGAIGGAIILGAIVFGAIVGAIIWSSYRRTTEEGIILGMLWGAIIFGATFGAIILGRDENAIAGAILGAFFGAIEGALISVCGFSILVAIWDLREGKR
jgi:hypothetical protein